MAKRKARVVWIHQSCIPKDDDQISASVHGESNNFKLPELAKVFVRFVESPAKKKARKKK